MGPKVEAACQFAETPGSIAGIGRLEDARAILEETMTQLEPAAANAILAADSRAAVERVLQPVQRRRRQLNHTPP